MFALFEGEQSKFYVGGLFGVGTAEALNQDADLIAFGGFLGTEYSFSGLPEIGFAWEVGYYFVSADAGAADIDANGILVFLGVHYYPEMLNL